MKNAAASAEVSENTLHQPSKPVDAAAAPQPSPAGPGESSDRESLSLDSGWKFFPGDVPMPVITGHEATYNNAKAGRAWGAAAPQFDDGDWRRLDLPHDWVVEAPFDPKANISQGYRARGIAWYRRHFRLDPADAGRHLELQFDGIATHATIWVNGLLMHRNWCGYTPANIDITSIATFGDQLNTIAVRVDADAQEGWWYEGGGIYRHTRLVKRPAVHLATYGVYANPVRDASGAWSVPVEAEVASIADGPAGTSLLARLFDPEGLLIGEARAVVEVPALGQAVARLPIAVESPRLWSLESPWLYTVCVTLEAAAGAMGGMFRDAVSVCCGFRTLRFDADRGFFLNDRPVKLKGTCNHQDHAGVGVAVPDALWNFRVRRLRELGSNAYRAAHHPPAPEFLDACDRLGLLVMDENRHFNPSPEYIGQLRLLVRRDRNHPSVFLWSVFNEEPMQGTPSGREMVRRMVAELRRWDATRPVTAAMNGGLDGQHGVFEAVDVVGFNYQHEAYDAFHARHPAVPLTSSEDTSAFMTRDEFETDVARNVIGSYDEDFAPWGGSHREAWRRIAERPYLAGGFVWTGFDYRGEPQRLAWPSVSSVFGIMDACGFPKTAYHIHQAHWVEGRTVLALAPHWNWVGREGRPVRVIAISNAERVALFLNGRALGEKAVSQHDYATWQVPYEAGRLEAVAYRGGAEAARAVVETTGPAVALHLEPDRPGLAGDGCDAMPITVSAVDAQGRRVPEADVPVTFELVGPGVNLGHGNGDHNCHDAEHGPTRRLYHGLAQLIVRSEPAVGELVVRATAPGLAAAEVCVPVRAVEPRPALPPAEPLFAIAPWRLAPSSVEKPDPCRKMDEADMNAWNAVYPGALQEFTPGHWALYRVRIHPWKRFQRDGGRIVLRGIRGQAEAWLDDARVAQKAEAAAGDLSFAMPAGTTTCLLTVLIRCDDTGETGFGGVTTLEGV